MNRPEYTCPPADTDTGPQPAIVLNASTARSIIDMLTWVAEFFGQYASPTVHTELRAFAATRDMHPVVGAGAIIDELGLRALLLRQTLGDAAGAVPQPVAHPGGQG
jgi:hypothetical protein